MKKLLIGSVLGLSILIGGCATKENIVIGENDKCMVNKELAPQWVCMGQEDDNFYYESGSAEFSKAGFGFTKKIAMADARANLSHRIKTTVKDKVTMYAASIGMSKNETVDKVNEHVSKQVASSILVNSSAVSLWRSKNRMFVLVKASKSSVAKETVKEVKSSFYSEDSKWQALRSEEGLKKLEEEF